MAFIAIVVVWPGIRACIGSAAMSVSEDSNAWIQHVVLSICLTHEGNFCPSPKDELACNYSGTIVLRISIVIQYNTHPKRFLCIQPPKYSAFSRFHAPETISCIRVPLGSGT